MQYMSQGTQQLLTTAYFLIYTAQATTLSNYEPLVKNAITQDNVWMERSDFMYHLSVSIK